MKYHTSQLLLITVMALPIVAVADDDRDHESGRKQCSIAAGTVNKIQQQLAAVRQLPNGGLFTPSRMWSAVVDREGVLCSVIRVGDAWPGSRAIAIAKANTANGFSNDALALSTANLYAPTQPGGFLYGLNNSNPFNPDFLPRDSGIGRVPGGVITFGGGVALYENGRVIGGLGLSGDTACADHVIAYRMRRLARLDGVPGGVGPGNTDNIIYAAPGATPTGFEHAHCGSGDLPVSAI
jgi:uncharacterized protein GlcG (DUF336 family)